MTQVSPYFPRRLRVLKLDHNGITGELPQEMSEMARLEIVHLHNNKLTGSPQVLLDGKLAELKVMHPWLTLWDHDR